MKKPILPSFYKRQKAGIQLIAYDGMSGRVFGFYSRGEDPKTIWRHDGFKTKRERDLAVLNLAG